MEQLSVNLKKRHGINQIGLKNLNTSNAFEREEIASSFDEEMIHFHVIDQILNMETDTLHKRKLILASVPDEKVVVKRLEVISQTSQKVLPMTKLLEEIVTSLSN